jgi:hypothetical protein
MCADRALTMSTDLATTARAYYIKREAIFRGAPGKWPIQAPPGLEHRLCVNPSRMWLELRVQRLAVVAYGGWAPGAWLGESIPPRGVDQSSLLRVRTRGTPAAAPVHCEGVTSTPILYVRLDCLCWICDRVAQPHS